MTVRLATGYNISLMKAMAYGFIHTVAPVPMAREKKAYDLENR